MEQVPDFSALTEVVLALQIFVDDFEIFGVTLDELGTDTLRFFNKQDRVRV